MFYCDFFWRQPARLNRWWSQISCLSLTNLSSAGVLASMWDRSAGHVFSLFSLLYHQLMLQRRRDVTGSRPDLSRFLLHLQTVCQPGRKLVQISESPKNLFFFRCLIQRWLWDTNVHILQKISGSTQVPPAEQQQEEIWLARLHTVRSCWPIRALCVAALFDKSTISLNVFVWLHEIVSCPAVILLTFTFHLKLTFRVFTSWNID